MTESASSLKYYIERPEWYKDLNPYPWQEALLHLNPEYTGWGPGQDAMYDDYVYDSWGEFTEDWSGLDDLNECVNFYFEITRSCHRCDHCDGTGYNQETLKIHKSFYGNYNGMLKWCDNLTQDEVDALFTQKRLHQYSEKPSAEEFNQNERQHSSHDSLNHFILTEVRAKRLNMWGHCSNCDGKGEIYDEPNAHVALNLWILHPRKGRSVGLRIEHIDEITLPLAIEFLKQAALRNKNRFEKIEVIK